jgi:hypothetical protein
MRSGANGPAQAGARGTACLVVRGNRIHSHLFRVEGASGVKIGKLAIRR